MTKGIINLLPDSLANQIAAGEVIQRPASVVKELLENAIDAGATSIKLIVKDAGKTLIQVADNGRGMNEVDARMCFERHATSKINSTEDLFNIRSFGFRGEALASIAAVAQVELKTQAADAIMGTTIVIEGSKVKKQTPSSMNQGSSFSVKNLFFNVPARRKFLKSDPVELRHIIDEFTHVVIANPSIHFTMHHNDNELYHLTPSNLRQRLINFFGKHLNDKIIPVGEETDFVKLGGYVGKPDLVKKSRGEQYFFVNNRFIKSSYLSHAVKLAYENLIPEDHHPWYVILINIDPAMIDVNIHPTKQEIKFENERLIYNYLKVAVKHALGKYSIAPSLDFDHTDELDIRMANSSFDLTKRASNKTPEHARTNSPTQQSSKQEREGWMNFYRDIQESSTNNNNGAKALTLSSNWTEGTEEKELVNVEAVCFQLGDSYVVSPIKSGLIIIEPQAAHERILYEKYIEKLNERRIYAQNTLFPETIQLDTRYVEILDTLLEELKYIGFNIEKAGKKTYVITAMPSEGLTVSGAEFVKQFLETYADNLELQMDIKDNVARSMAMHKAIKRKTNLSKEEMQSLIDQLFAAKMPYTSPSDKKCFIMLNKEEIDNRFK